MTADAAFDEALTRVEELLDKVRGAWNDIVDGVNHVLSWLPDFLAGAVTSAFQACSAKVSEVFTEMTKIFTDRGSAGGLRTAGESWNEQIGHRASTQAGLLTKESLETDNEWSGAAADRYGEAVTAQGRALSQVKTMTENLQSVLNEIASTLTALWIGIAIALGIYAGAAIVCVVGICSGVATVPAIGTFVAASLAFLAAITTLSNNAANTFAEKKAKLEQLASMDAQFANGEWPSAVADKMTGGGWNPK